MENIETIKKIAKVLDVDAGKLNINEDNMISQSIRNKNINGFTTILTAMIRDSTTKLAKNCLLNLEIEAQIDQWIQYSGMIIVNAIKDKETSKIILEELNNFLSSRSFFVGNNITVADLVVFYSIYELMKSLSTNDLSNYLNLCRWFEYLQQLEDIPRNPEKVNLSTALLISGAH